MYRSLLLGVILLYMPFMAWAQQDTIADQRLNEVVVTAKLPLVEMNAGKITYRIDASITQRAGSLYDVLTSLPGVMIDSGGNILLNGQKDAKVLLDGKSTHLSGEELVNLLKSTPATNTEKIDLITQLGANHDAAGSAGVIDIHTRKIKLRGMNLALNANGSLGQSGSTSGSAAMNLRENKFNLYLSYSYYKGRNTIDILIDRIFNRDGGKMVQDSYRKRNSYSHYFKTGYDYYWGERTIWSTVVSGNFSGRKEKGNMFTEIQDGKTAGNTYSSTHRNWNNLAAGTNILHRLKKKGGELSASFDYFHYYHAENQLMNSFKPDTLSGAMRGDINLYVGQVDAVYPLTDCLKLQAGGKTSFVEIDNTASYMRPSTSGWLPDGSLGSCFVYGENNNALYVQAGGEFKRFKFTAGLRLEHTRMHGDFSGNTLQKDSAFTSNYLHLFPAFALQYNPNPDNGFQLSYGRRITRPNYSDLNPFTYIFDDYTHSGGNTKLRPSFSDNIELAYVYHRWFQAALFFSHTEDAIMKSYREKDRLHIYVSPQNLSYYTRTGIRINAAKISPASFWTMNLTAIGVYNNYRWTESENRLGNRRFTPILSWINQFNITDTWSAECSANYNGKMAYGQSTVHPVLEVNLGIQKKIFGNKGTVSLFAKDIFNTASQDVDIQALGTRASVDERHSRRLFGIAFSWYLQKGEGAKEHKRKTGIDETKRVDL